MHQDQAEKLRRDLEREKDLEGIMASHLPPRSEYHRKKKGNRKKREKGEKISYPVIKILAVIFLLLPVIIAAMIFYYEEVSNRSPAPGEGENGVFDQVEFDNKN